jgi:hypothetical protein
MVTDQQSLETATLARLKVQWNQLKDELFNHDAFGLNWHRVCRHIWGIEDMVGPVVAKQWQAERYSTKLG